MTSSRAVFVAAIRVKPTHLIKSCVKTRKKENGNKRYFLHKSPSKISFRHLSHSLLTRADARGSADIICREKRCVLSMFLKVDSVGAERMCLW